MVKTCVYAGIAYLLFVVYGSLVPLEYRHIPWQEAQNRFAQIPYLALGMESRADWIANILLYIPLAFFWSSVFAGNRSPGLRLFGISLVFFCCLVLAGSIEFLQLYFPPRTVSINDLIAETLGSSMGVAIAIIWNKQLLQFYQNLSFGGLLSIKSLLLGYMALYVLLSFFPFDFVTSYDELESKLENGTDHWFIPWDKCLSQSIICAVKLSIEALVLTPAGGLLYMVLPHIRYQTLLAVILGLFIGTVSELIQLFLVSGTAQGISIIMRVIGLALGLKFADWLSKQQLLMWRTKLRPLLLLGVLPYLFSLFMVNGGFSDSWLDMAAVSDKLANTRFLPFYYFYYTTETVALTSLLYNFAMYWPIGLAFGLWEIGGIPTTRIGSLTVTLFTIVIASLVEIMKLFLGGKHADPTDILIAIVAAVIAYQLLIKLTYWFYQEKLQSPNYAHTK